MLCNFSMRVRVLNLVRSLVRVLKYLTKNLNFLCPQKVEKNHPKKLHTYGSWEVFFSLKPRLPKTAQNFISVL